MRSASTLLMVKSHNYFILSLAWENFLENDLTDSNQNGKIFQNCLKFKRNCWCKCKIIIFFNMQCQYWSFSATVVI